MKTKVSMLTALKQFSFLSLFIIVATSTNQAWSCGTNPMASQGTPNFDGSCTFNSPRVRVGGDWAGLSPVKYIPGQGNVASLETAIGFCTIQDMVFGRIDLQGCDGPPSMCDRTTIEMSPEGQLTGSDPNAHRSGVILTLTCYKPSR